MALLKIDLTKLGCHSKNNSGIICEEVSGKQLRLMICTGIGNMYADHKIVDGDDQKAVDDLVSRLYKEEKELREKNSLNSKFISSIEKRSEWPRY